MNAEFDMLVHEILEAGWKAEPVEATYVGVHRYDDLFPQLDSESRAQRLGEVEDHIRLLGQFAEDALDEDERLDRRLLMDQLKTSAYTTRRLEPHTRLASTYTDEASFGVYLLQMRQFAPVEERANSVRARLRALPGFLEVATANLRQGSNIPREWTETALEEAKGCIHFFDEEVPRFAEQVPSLKADIVEAAGAAADTFRAFVAFLGEELLPRSDGHFAAGKDVFDFLLTKAHGLPYDSDDLLEIGNEILQATLGGLDAVAREADPSAQDWAEALKCVKKTHPDDEELVRTYAQQMSAAREFVAQHGLVTIPEGETLEVVETPVFQRPITPYAAYVPPAPFEKEQTGVFWVTPVDSTKPPEVQNAQRQDHNVYGIPITALHEGYPGHHLQLVRANQVGSDVRKQLGTPVFWEGWALYCEEMMYEQGFYADPRSRLCQLRDQLWRACRVIIDVKLHTGQMSFDQAVDMLVEVAKLERPNALAEVRRYVQTPTQPMSYAIGKREIMNLRRDYQAAQGEHFNLKGFHDALLSYGSIPVGLIRERMLKQPRP